MTAESALARPDNRASEIPGLAVLVVVAGFLGMIVGAIVEGQATVEPVDQRGNVAQRRSPIAGMLIGSLAYGSAAAGFGDWRLRGRLKTACLWAVVGWSVGFASAFLVLPAEPPSPDWRFGTWTGKLLGDAGDFGVRWSGPVGAALGFAAGLGASATVLRSPRRAQEADQIARMLVAVSAGGLLGMMIDLPLQSIGPKAPPPRPPVMGLAVGMTLGLGYARLSREPRST